MKLRLNLHYSVFALVLLWGAAAAAQTYHNGSINQSETWAAGEHVVNGYINIQNNAVLTVAPGAVVKFQNNYTISVDIGSISLHGTKDQPIIFTHQTSPDTPARNSWQGIYVQKTSGVSGGLIEWVEFRGASTALYLQLDGGSIAIKNSKFSRGSTGIEIYQNSCNDSTVTIESSYFEDLDRSIGANANNCGNHSLVVRANEFKNFRGPAVDIGSSGYRYNSSLARVENNLIHNPQTGVNNNAALSFQSSSRVQVRFNTLIGTPTDQYGTTYGIYLSSPYTGTVVAGNVVIGFKQAGIAGYGSATVAVNNNVFGHKYNGTTDCNYQTSTSSSTCKLAEANNTNLDPMFVDTANGQFDITNKTLIDSITASSYPDITTDFRGNARGTKLTPGAFEQAIGVLSVEAVPGYAFIPRAGKTVIFRVLGDGFTDKCGTPQVNIALATTLVQYISPSELQVQATIAQFASGPRDVQVVIPVNLGVPGCEQEKSGKLFGGFSIVPPLTLDSLASIVPNQAAVGDKISVTITGTGFYAGDVITLLNGTSVEASIIVSNVKIVSTSKITADLSLLPGPTSKLNLKLRVDSVDKEFAEVPNAFTVRPQGTPTEHSGKLPGSDPSCSGNSCSWEGTNRIIDSLTVPSGVTLTLQPGAEVLVDAGKSITIEAGGSLVIAGTELNPVELKPSVDGANWAGVRILSNTTSKTLSYVRISGTTVGLYADGVTGLIVRDSVIEKSGQGIWVTTGADVTLQDSLISDVNDGGYVSNGGTLRLRRVMLTQYGNYGINVFDASSKLDVASSVFYLPKSSAKAAIISKGSGLIALNTFDGAGPGLVPTGGVGIDVGNASPSVATYVVGNIVTLFKTQGLIYNSGNTQVRIAHNDGWQNGATTRCEFQDKKDGSCANEPSNPNKIGTTAEPNLSVDPKFRDLLNHDYRLLGASTLFDQFDNKLVAGLPTDDLGKNPRDAKIDIGAWETLIIKDVEPGYGIRGDTALTVALIGHNFPSKVEVLFDSNVPDTETQVVATNPTTVDANKVNVTLTIDAKALLGLWDVEIKSTTTGEMYRAPSLFRVIDPYLSDMTNPICIEDALCTISFDVCNPDGAAVDVQLAPNATENVEGLKLDTVSTCSYTITFTARLIDSQNDTEQTTLDLTVADTGHVESKKTLTVTIRNKILGNSKPTLVALDTPENGAILSELTPMLRVINATDGDGDPLVYQFEVDTANTFLKESPNYVSKTITEDKSGKTIWQLESLLKDHTRYYWRVRAYDGLEYGDWSEVNTFLIKTSNVGPTKPVLIDPIDGKVVQGPVAPIFVLFASDPDDGRDFTLNFELYSDAGLTQKVKVLEGIKPGAGPNTTLSIGGVLADGTYYWRVKAIDPATAESEWSEVKSFVMTTGLIGDGTEGDTTTPDGVEPDGVTPDTDNADTGGDDTSSYDGGNDVSANLDNVSPNDDGSNPDGLSGDSDTSKKGGGGCQQTSGTSNPLAFLLLLLVAVAIRRWRAVRSI
ncbi:MAG: right-handed parallel beta-helix repeat-containing protein [Myxococcales bacterium]|nr:right-handed parallel beta-helix repeat-containing protein [Myxococcales bacterium]